MNLPNKLTIIRIIMIPIIILVFIFPYTDFNIYLNNFNINGISLPLKNLIVLTLFIVASITDFFDGYIARKYNLVTTFGKFLDPIADKLLVNTILIMCASQSMIPVLPVVLMIARDTIVDGCRMIASKENIVIAADLLGKLKTVLQMFAIIVILLNNLPFELVGIPLSDILLWFSMFVSIVSGISYFMQVKSFVVKTM